MILERNFNIIRVNYRKVISKWACVECVRYKSSAELLNKSYSDTILIPKTNFPVRSNNAQKEEIVQKAQFAELYSWQRKHLNGPEFVLHDGPPYANGDLHMGHAVNKIIKDINNRSQLVQGNKVHYVPGWDCHGLPIELKALQKVKKNTNKSQLSDPVNIRQIARAFALETVEKQKASFKSWGVMADWDNQCYLTLSKGYIQNQLQKFYDLYKKGLIFRAMKPVYWSPSSRTALAEAELEYDPHHKSREVYVSFPIHNVPDALKSTVAGKSLHALIWTTTPWSLVGNRAIAYSTQLKYKLIRITSIPDKVFIVGGSSTLPCDCVEVAGLDVAQLQHLSYYNKLLQTDCPFLQSDHVTDGKGTGLVHIAPAHGPEDFLVALKNGIVVDCKVDEEGRYTNLDSSLNGLHVLKEGQEAVIAKLGSDVIHQGTFTHSYPLDWRTKKPVLLRASEQWFIDTAALKSKALAALQDVEILPPSSETQYRRGLTAQIEKRPYWCISRQRAWGVPIPVLYSRDEVLLDQRIIDHLSKMIDAHGPDVWWTHQVKDLLPPGFVEEKGLDINNIVKGKDIMDIWLDSGLSWSTLRGAAQLYSEGVDQLTGWFQASLLTSIGLTGGAPYKSVFVHGFVVDESKRKMSKSIGNVIDPATIIHGGKNRNNQPAYGVDTLRWWVASHGTQHSQIVISNKLLDECQQEVIRIRNIIKYLLSVISDVQEELFDEKPILNYLDQYMIAETQDFAANITEAYNSYKYHQVTVLLLYFISNKVSALYCDLVKDRLYCSVKDSNERLSAQLVIHTVFTILAKSLGPILPHLIEEAWQHHPLGKKPFFFTQNIPVLTVKNVDTGLMGTVLNIKKDIKVLANNGNTKKLVANIELNEDLHGQLSRLNKYDEATGGSVLTEILDVSSVILGCSKTEKPWMIKVSDSIKKQCLRCRKYNALDCSDKCLRCENVLLSQF